MQDWYFVVATLGLGLVTLVSRGWFLAARKPMSMPDWLRRGLNYAPAAALAGVIFPALFIVDGHLMPSYDHAQWLAALAASAANH